MVPGIVGVRIFPRWEATLAKAFTSRARFRGSSGSSEHLGTRITEHISKQSVYILGSFMWVFRLLDFTPGLVSFYIWFSHFRLVPNVRCMSNSAAQGISAVPISVEVAHDMTRLWAQLHWGLWLLPRTRGATKARLKNAAVDFGCLWIIVSFCRWLWSHEIWPGRVLWPEAHPRAVRWWWALRLVVGTRGDFAGPLPGSSAGIDSDSWHLVDIGFAALSLANLQVRKVWSWRCPGTFPDFQRLLCFLEIWGKSHHAARHLQASSAESPAFENHFEHIGVHHRQAGGFLWFHDGRVLLPEARSVWSQGIHRSG